MVMEIALGRQHRPQIFDRCCALMTNRPDSETSCRLRAHDKTSLVTNANRQVDQGGRDLSWTAPLRGFGML